jgi:RHS repeat-associated protein
MRPAIRSVVVLRLAHFLKPRCVVMRLSPISDLSVSFARRLLSSTFSSVLGWCFAVIALVSLTIPAVARAQRGKVIPMIGGSATLVVNPANGSTGAAGSSTGQTYAGFTVENTGTASTTATISIYSCTGAVSSCSASPSSATISAGSSVPVTVTFNTASTGTGAITLIARWPGNNVAGVVTVTLPPPPEVAATVSAPSGPVHDEINSSVTRAFIVHDPNASSESYTWSATCSSVASCSGQSGSVGVAANSSSSVNVTYSTGGTSGASGTVSFTAGDAAGNATAALSVITNDYTPGVVPVSGTVGSLVINQSVTDTFNVRNAGNEEAIYTVTPSCDGAITSTCVLANSMQHTDGVDLLPGETAAVPVRWEATGSAPTSHVSLTAAFTNAHGTWTNTGTRTLTTSTWTPTISANGPPSGGFAPDATGLIQSFTVTNTGNSSATYSFTVACTGSGAVTASCAVVTPGPGSIAGNGGTGTVQVRFNSGDAGTSATMTLTATASPYSGSGSASISVNQYVPSVSTATPSFAWYNGSPVTKSFEIHNPNAVAGTYSWSMTCHGAAVTCTPTSGSGPIPPADSLYVSAPFSTTSSAPNSTGAVVLTASNSAGSGSDSIAVRIFDYTVTVVAVSAQDTLAAGANGTATFTVRNVGTDSMAYVFTASCDNVAATQCVQPPTTPVPLLPSHQTTVSIPFTAGANFNSGSVTLHVSPDDPALNDSASVAVVVRSPGALTVNTDFMNEDNQDMGACAASCFTAQYSISTVPFYTLGTARTTSLVYNGDRALPRPFIYADVSPNTGAGPAQKFLLQVRKGGVNLPFTNGEDTLVFAGSSVPVRLTGQIDMTSYPTDVYPVDVIVTAVYSSGGPETVTSHVNLLVVNENKSAIAKGWAIAGPQDLYDRDSLAIIVDGTGSAEVFHKCGGYCYQSPAGDFSTLSFGDTTTGHHSWTRTYPDGTTLYFGNPTNGVANDWMATDPTGRGVYTGRDSQNRVVEIDDPQLSAAHWGSYATNVGYGSNGISWIREPSNQPWTGRTMNFRVGTDSLLYAVTAANGDSTVFTYDSQHRLSTVRDVNGAVTTYTYQPVTGKVSQITGASVPTDAGGGTTTLVQPTVAMTPWQTIGVPTGPTASSPATAVSDSAVKATVKDAAGAVTRFTVDRWGQPLVTTDPMGNVTTIKRTGMFATEVDESEGRVSTYVYNGPELIHSTPAGDSVTNYYYGVHSQLDSVDGKGLVAEMRGLNSNGTVAWVRQNGDVTRTTKYAYDPSTWQVDTVTDQMGHKTVMTYDPTFGNLMQTTAPDSQVSTTTFDRYGRDSTASRPGYATTKTIYDIMNRPASVSDGVNPTPTTFTYDPLGRFSIVTDPMGQSYRTEYDTLGRVIKRYDATGSGKYNSYRYDVAGRATSTTNRRGQRMDVTYDSLGRMLTRTDAATGAVDRFSYSADGLTSNSSNANAYATTETDVMGGTSRTTINEDSVQYVNGQTTNPSFNVPDTSTVTAPIFGGAIPSRRVVATDPLLGALGSVSLGGHLVTFGYDYRLDARTSTVYVPPTRSTAGSTRADSYAPLTGLLTETSFNVAAVDSVLHRAYGYDVAGRITSEQLAIKYAPDGDGARERERQFAYDSLGRLTSVTVRRGTCMPWPSDSTAPDSLSSSFGWRYTCGALQADSGATYSYDAVGNRKDNGAVVAAGNRLIKFNGDTITYDDDGNMTSRYSPATGASRQYAWNASGQLDSTIVVSAPDPQTGVRTTMVERYFYDSNGQLVHLQHGYIVNGALVYADSSQNWAVYQGAQVSELVQSSLFYTDVAYDDGTDRPAMEYLHLVGSSDSWHSEVMDAMGNVGGAVVDDTIGVGYTYDAWGANTSTSWDNTEVLGWKGLQSATRSGLVYVRARWYDPAVGRFISEDPAGLSGGLNQYAFAGDDPINASDPSGEIPGDGSDCQAALDALYSTGAISGDEDIHGCPGLPVVNVNARANPNNWIDPSEPSDPPSILNNFFLIGGQNINGIPFHGQPPNSWQNFGTESFYRYDSNGDMQTRMDFHDPHYPTQPSPHSNDVQGGRFGPERPTNPDEILELQGTLLSRLLQGLESMLKGSTNVTPVIMVKPTGCTISCWFVSPIA